MKNNKTLLILLLFIKGFLYYNTCFADPVNPQNSFFNTNESKINFNNQNEKNQQGMLYIKGLFLISPCNLITNEVKFKGNNIEITISNCDFLNGKNKNIYFSNELIISDSNNSISDDTIMMEKINRYNNYDILNYIMSENQKRKISGNKYHILTLKLQYN